MDFLLNSFLTRPYYRNRKSCVLHTATKVICFLFIILSIIPVHSQVKRAPSCNTADTEFPGQTPLDTLFCSPKEDEVYGIGQDVILSWNPSNANLFGSDNKIEVYLIRRRQNATGLEEVVMLDPGNLTKYLLVQIEENSMNFTVEPRWLPDYKYSIPSENTKHTFFFRLIPKGTDREYSSPDFIVLEPANSTTQTNTTSTSETPKKDTSESNNNVDSASNASNANNANNTNNTFTAVIAVASVAAFLAFIALVIAFRSRKRVNGQTKHQSLSNLSASSSTPIIGKFGSNNRDLESSGEAESIHSTTPLANKEEMRSKPKSTAVSFSNESQPISASDAALLSDAFRKGLRKPDWKPEEDDDDTNLTQEERLRRREAKELMEKELAEEGTDLRNITRRPTKVEIRNISDELEKDSASRSSESGSK